MVYAWQLRMLRQRPTALLAPLLGLAAAAGMLAPETAAGSAAWAVAVLGVFFGYGALARRALRRAGGAPALGLGEQLVVGAVVWIGLGGLLLAVDRASRIPLLVIGAVGLGAAAWELASARPPPAAAEPRPSRWLDQEHLARLVLGAMLLLYLIAIVLGSLNTRGNPFDDHVAYTPFVKRLLDTGDLLEPFSYRRISAYGGQTLLLAAAALRGNLETTDLVDRGLFVVITTLVALGMMKRRGTHVGVAAVILLFLFCLPDLSINCGASWTGAAMFLAAYGFAAREELAPRVRLILVFATCGAACTLRQNYLLPAGLFAAFALLAHVRDRAASAGWAAALRGERGVILGSIAAAAALVLPYAVATFRSSGSPLYPILLGYMNPLAPTRPAGAGLLDELQTILGNALSAEPIHIWWLFFPFMLLARDERRQRPWLSLLASTTLGFAFLLHSFLISDTTTLWRYAFGYMTPLALAFLIELGDRLPFGERHAPTPPPGEAAPPAPGEAAPPAPGSPAASAALRLPSFAVFLIWLGVLSQLVESRALVLDRLRETISNARATIGMGARRSRGLQESYQALQESLPAGAPVAILLDDPYWLDYDRNRFVNLDLPGFAAPVAMPSFSDAETWRSYFLAQGLRHLAFIDPNQSTYLFRRAGWVKRLLNDTELWRFMAARMIDTADAFLALAASSRVLFHDQGMYVLDLAPEDGGAPPRYAAPALPEEQRMDAFVRRLSERELSSNAWQLVSRSDVLFLPDGYGPSNAQVEFPNHMPAQLGGALTALFGRPPPEPAHRWLIDRSRMKVRGDGKRHRLRALLWVDLPRLAAAPRLSLTVDGEVLAETSPDAAGNVSFDVESRCAGWCDVYLVSSTIGEFWHLPENLKVLKLLVFDWTRAP